MGVGMPDELAEYVARGIDMMDCVLPSRAATVISALAYYVPWMKSFDAGVAPEIIHVECQNGPHLVDD